MFTRLLRKASDLKVMLFKTFKTIFFFIYVSEQWRVFRDKPDNISARLGHVKCCQAIENSIAVDCFEVRNIEEIFKNTLTEESRISTDFEVFNNIKKPPTSEDNKTSTTQSQKPQDIEIHMKKEKRPISKTEAKDFLGPLRNSENTSSQDLIIYIYMSKELKLIIIDLLRSEEILKIWFGFYPRVGWHGPDEDRSQCSDSPGVHWSEDSLLAKWRSIERSQVYERGTGSEGEDRLYWLYCLPAGHVAGTALQELCPDNFVQKKFKSFKTEN